MFHAVVGREGDLHHHLGVRLGSDQLFLEAGDELARAQNQLSVGGRAAFERLTVDPAHEVDHDHVAVSRLDRLACASLIGAVLRGKLGHSLIDLSVAGRIDGTLQLQCGHIHRLELGDQFDRDLVGEVGLAREDLFHVRFELQVRLAGGPQLIVVQRLLGAFAEGLFDHLAHQRAAVDAAHVRRRHLAGAEALEVQLRGDLGDPGLKLVGQIFGGDRHTVGAAQAFA